jgi:selenocysteine-specific elongation factor
MRHIVIGTAGHVDHGKTALVKRLTGIDTDRLKEEKIRGLSIELGFAPLTLKNGQTISIIDVPGHERFIKHMLMGVSGIDFVLIVIAADDGIMPQTREHTDILCLLGLEHGIVVLTKTDLADPVWIELVKEEIAAFLKDTPFKAAPIIQVSSLTGEGLETLMEAIETECAKVIPRPQNTQSRLAVDRVFSKKGYGTVVTGTLWSGCLKIGDDLTVFPGRRKTRVRNLQVHGHERTEAFAGERVAINLAGIGKQHIPRGSWLSSPDLLHETHRLDAALFLLQSAPPMKQRSRVHVHHGAMDVLGRIHLLDRDALLAGEQCYAQLTLETPLAVLAGDRLILRFYSPAVTIGGAVVLNAAAVKLKRYREDILNKLHARAQGGPEETLLQKMNDIPAIWSLSDIKAAFSQETAEITSLLESLSEKRKLRVLAGKLYITDSQETKWWSFLKEQLQKFHKQYPLRPGIGKEEIFSQYFSQCRHKDYDELLIFWRKNRDLAVSGQFLSLKDFSPSLNPTQKTWSEHMIALLGNAVFAPPSIHDLSHMLKIPEKETGEILNWLIHEQFIVQMDENTVFLKTALSQAEHIIREQSAHRSFTLAQARDWLGTSRKYALYVVGYLAHKKLTRRDGESHIWIS